MINNEYNNSSEVYKVQTFRTTQTYALGITFLYCIVYIKSNK